MTYSQLETAIAAAVAPLRSTRLGQDLRANSPGSPGRNSKDESVGGITLAAFELSLGVPIRRASHIVSSAAWAGRPLELSPADHQYLEWSERALKFVRALSSKFWGDIGADISSAFFDADDLPPFAAAEVLPTTRLPHPPALLPSARAVGLEPDEIRPFANVYRACRQTPVYESARSAVANIRANPLALPSMRARHAILRELVNTRRGPRLQDDVVRFRGILEEERASSGPDVQRLREYSELVQATLTTLLAWVERHEDLLPVDPSTFPIGVTWGSRLLRVHITTTGNYWFLKAGSPFEIALGGPLDGVYVCQGFTLRGFGPGGLADLHGERLSELELPLSPASP